MTKLHKKLMGCPPPLMNGGLCKFLTLLLFMLASFEGAKGQPCNGASQIVCSSSNNVTLTNPGTAGYTYDWYDRNQTVLCPFTSMGSGTWVGSGSSYNDAFANGVHSLFYVAKSGGVAVCTTYVDLYVNPLTIGGYLGNTLPGCTLQVTMPCIGFSNYKWYRSGQMIPGATSSSYVANWPGDYSCNADLVACGNLTSNTISIGCGANAYSQNHTFTKGITPITDTVLVLDGLITIPEDATLNISNSVIYVKDGSEILVQKGVASLGGKLNITNCQISSCGKWNGIYVEGSSTNAVNNIGNGWLGITNTQIRDAGIGIYGYNNAVMDISNCRFENNFRHIHLEEYSGVVFPGNWPTPGVDMNIRNCRFGYLMETAPTFSPSLNIPAPVHAPPIRNHVYFNVLRNIKLTADTFDCFNWSGATKDNVAIEAREISVGSSSGWRGFEVHSCKYNGDFHKIIDVELFDEVDILGPNRTTGDIDYGIYAVHGNDMIVTGAHMENTSSSAGGITGLYTSQVDALDAQSNFFKHFINGIEFYNYNGQTYTSRIHHNEICTTTYGIVVAPECHPVTGTCSNVNSYATLNNVRVTCNKIFNNQWGIIGTGDNFNQGSAGLEWENFFCTNANAGTTTNSKADIAWYKPVNPNAVPPLLRIAIYYKALNQPIWNAAGASISLDGHSVTSANHTTYIDFQPGTAGNCRGSFKQDPTDLEADIPKHFKIYPNPFSNQVSISNPYDKQLNIAIYDLTGRLVLQAPAKAAQTNTFDMAQLPDGLYLVKVLDAATGVLMTTEKLIKTGN